MIHIDPLPGTPRYESMEIVIEKARHEANIYKGTDVVSSKTQISIVINGDDTGLISGWNFVREYA